MAYHQGTVWAWLIGPFVDAWLKVHPAAERDAQRFLQGFVPHLAEAGVGTISEIFDATPPSSLAGAWRKRGAWPRCCARGSRPRPPDHPTFARLGFGAEP